MQTVGELMKLLAQLDPTSPLTYSLWTRPPGDRVPPKRMDKTAKEPQASVYVRKLSEEQLREVRARVIDKQNFSDVAKHFNVHRATVSRYIHQEMKAGRMGKLADGSIVAAKGAYDLQTGTPVVRAIEPT